jgi:hypothetical protein
MSVFQQITGLISLIFALSAAVLVGRRQKTRVRALLLGVLAGLVTALAFGALAGFLPYVLPAGQMRFWLASVFARF